MLEVHSPIPMTEGESIALGQFSITTRQLFHFFIGFAVSSPVLAVVYVLGPLLKVPAWSAFLIGAAAGFLFAAVPVRERPLAEVLWLSIRYARRPKVVLYDRHYRVKAREEEKGHDSL